MFNTLPDKRTDRHPEFLVAIEQTLDFCRIKINIYAIPCHGDKLIAQSFDKRKTLNTQLIDSIDRFHGRHLLFG